MKKFKKLLTAVLAGAVMLLAAGCLNGYVSNTLVFNDDFSGSRTLQARLGVSNDPDNNDEYCYYYLTKHGDDLAEAVDGAYRALFSEADYQFLKPTVTSVDGTTDTDDDGIRDTGEEVVTISFEFADYGEYLKKLEMLVGFNGGPAEKVADAPEGVISWHDPEDPGTGHYYESPVLTYVEGFGYSYQEKGFVSKMLFQATWDYFVDHPYHAETNPDGLLDPSGRYPGKTYGNFGHARNGGFKIDKYTMNLCGENYIVTAQQQDSGNNYTYADVSRDMSLVTDFTLLPVIGNRLQEAESAGKLGAQTLTSPFAGFGLDDTDCKWYSAAVSYNADTEVWITERGEELGTGASISYTFTEFGKKYFCVENGGMVVFLSAEAKEKTVTPPAGTGDEEGGCKGCGSASSAAAALIPIAGLVFFKKRF